MIIETLSTFPDMYASVMGASMMRIAQEKGILQLRRHTTCATGRTTATAPPTTTRTAAATAWS